VSKSNHMNDTARNAPAQRPKLAKRAREFADAGDRLFVSVAQGLGRIGDWAYREAGDVADSAVSTMAVAQGEVRPRKTTKRPPRKAASEPPPERKHVASNRVRPAPGEVRGGADLLSADVPSVTAAPPSNDGLEPETASLPDLVGPRAEQSAGVVPLVRALGNVVAEYSQVGYRELDQDERFWKLLNLIWLLAGTWDAEEAGGAEPSDSEPSDSDGDAQESGHDEEADSASGALRPEMAVSGGVSEGSGL